MTLLGVLSTEGRITFAADRQESARDTTFTGGSQMVDKPMRMADTGLMWSFAGVETVGHRIGAWITKSANTTNWDALRKPLQYQVDQENLSAGPGTQTHCLVAGFIGGVPGILHIDNSGKANWTTDEPEALCSFVGNSRFGATRAWEFNTLLHPEDATPEHLCDLMRLMIRNDSSLKGLTVWEILPDSEPKRTVCEDTV